MEYYIVILNTHDYSSPSALPLLVVSSTVRALSVGSTGDDVTHTFIPVPLSSAMFRVAGRFTRTTNTIHQHTMPLLYTYYISRAIPSLSVMVMTVLLFPSITAVSIEVSSMKKVSSPSSALSSIIVTFSQIELLLEPEGNVKVLERVA